MRLRNPHSVPLYNLASQLVYALKSSDVQDVVVEGRLLMHRRRLLTLDQQAILAAAERLAAKVRPSLRQAP